MSHKCDWEGCPKTFTSKSAKIVHYKSEHLKITYACPTCCKAYASKCARDKHVRQKHDGIQREIQVFNCPDCDRSFSQKHGLTKHQRNKHGSGSFPCLECDVVKENRDQLAYHVKTVHRNHSFECCVCKTKRASKQNLKTHMLQKHPDYKEEAEPLPRKKPKLETIPPKNDGVKFILGIQNELKDTSGEKNCEGNTICFKNGCYGTRLSFGKKGGDKISCSKHKDQHPDGELVNLSDLRLCTYIGCITKGCISIRDSPSHNFCKHHVDVLVSKGLRKEFIVRSENSNKCQHEGCTIYASYEGRKYCIAHSTTKISYDKRQCPLECCSMGGPRPIPFHPEYENKSSEFYNKRICSFARRAMIEDAMMKNDIDRVKSLLEHFKLEKVLTLNAQSAFRFVCEKEYHKELSDCEYIRFDEQVHDGRKTTGNKRPDIFYKWKIDGIGYGIQVEYDENGEHEDDDERLRIIEKESGCVDNIYVIRVRGGHDTKDPVCTRVHISDNFEYYKVTESGKEVALDVVDLVLERIDWIHKSLKPDSKNWKVVV